ncbi:translation initiation factor 2 subunit 2 [Cryptococcus neoformans AD2-60a]|nr:translation initiation factor 2 subunit 2 [Cryptococcus neoformans var. grubii AD2-60a]OXC84497.1 translation initiation factor 2 subunit 2 [Cryptococcus neoformans var. grubii AD1-7a]OXH32353.1 translation initiation factor 2 subunit 2 [Cryptococcus neoformans var. grubii]
MDPNVDLFAGMKKKKKKVAVADTEETPEPSPAPAPAPADETPAPVAAAPAPAPAAKPEAVAKVEAPVATPEPSTEKPAEDSGDLFADLKKKKKKKKDIPLDLESAEPSATVDGLDVPMKKKKSKKTTDFSKELEDLDAEQNQENADIEGDLGDDVFQKSGEGETSESGKEAWVVENREPTYPELLKRFFNLLHAHNPELAGEKRRYTIVPPQVAREGTKKTLFANITDICRRMRRQPEHVIQFLYSELGTTGSVDGAQRLVMKGRYTQKQIENVLRKYIVEYVTCKICKSPDTILDKENRLYFMTCESCGSRRSVSAIKTGFQAQIGKRIKAA